jgi:hypothetical protein
VITALTRVDNRVLALSVPSAAQGEFYRVFTRPGKRGRRSSFRRRGRWMTAAASPRSVIVWQANVESKAPTWGPASPLFRVGYSGSSSTRPRTR